MWLPNHNNSAKGAHRMEENTPIGFVKPGTISDPLTELLRMGARKLIEAAIQAELAEFLQQFETRKTSQGKRGVIRNGYQPEREILTGIGAVSIRIPKVRSRTGEPVTFRSALVPPYIRKRQSLEAALPWLYLKGISTGEMQDALSALVGPEAKGLSPGVIRRLKESWVQEYAEWKKGRLDKDRWVYLWADGIYSGIRASTERLCALVIVGVNDRGEKHFLAIEDGMRESIQSWKDVLLDLKERGLSSPKLAIGDGAMGFWGALEEVFPQTKPQRCWVHKTANVLNYLPDSLQEKAKKGLHEIWMSEGRDRQKAFDTFLKTYGAKYPKATECLLKDRDPLLAFYDFPAEHWIHIRTTNPIESTFATIRHRTDQARGCFSKETILTMMFKLGLCAEKRWRKIKGFNHLALVLEGKTFKDGNFEDNSKQDAA